MDGGQHLSIGHGDPFVIRFQVSHSTDILDLGREEEMEGGRGSTWEQKRSKVGGVGVGAEREEKEE